jgi:hypothetical protein
MARKPGALPLYEWILMWIIGPFGGLLAGTAVASAVSGKSEAGYIVGGAIGLVAGVLFVIWVAKDEARNA